MSGIMVMSCAPQQKKLVYPETAKVDTVDVYFGTQVPDPYRWLENDTSAATTAWVEACLLYTSDAADDLLCVDLGGRGIIKKQNRVN